MLLECNLSVEQLARKCFQATRFRGHIPKKFFRQDFVACAAWDACGADALGSVGNFARWFALRTYRKHDGQDAARDNENRSIQTL